VLVKDLYFMFSVLLPMHAYQKREVHAIRTDFSASTFSDHMVLLRVFQVI